MAKKRANGEGSMRKLGKSWEIRVMDGYRPDGKPKIYTFSGKTQAEARAKFAEYKRQRDAGVAWVQYTFSEWADKWYESHRENVSATTAEGYKYTLKALKDHFGEKKIADIRAIHIEDFLRKLREDGRADASIAKCRGMLFQIFRKAEASDLVRKNPVAFADKMRARGPVKEKDAFTAGEVQLLMEKLPEDRIGWSIRLLLGTGMRTQELLALEPKHIAEDGSVIEIRQAINMVKGTPVIGSPKSRDSYRDVPIPPSLRRYALQLREQGGTYIWESPRKPGYPCNPSHFRDKFREALEEIPGVRMLTPHSCRHTYVSQMQALGVDLATIQSIVGHADLDMTRHYLHVQEPVRKAAADRFSEAFGSETE